jgi:hypothetical protein
MGPMSELGGGQVLPNRVLPAALRWGIGSAGLCVARGAMLLGAGSTAWPAKAVAARALMVAG